MAKSLPDKLYHYTTIQGLKGIIESQTLWATHYNYLNDAEEIVHFRPRLPGILRPIFTRLFSRLSPEQERRLIEEFGSVDRAIEHDTEALARTMYETTFAIGDGERSFAEPHILSFCKVDKDHEWIGEHGLLSQWRGYGIQGGYAIEFDWEKLHKLLTLEGKKWAYSRLSAGDVVYSSATEDEINDEFKCQINAMQKNWTEALRTGDSNELRDTYGDLISCACRFKHRGFSEEREFRIVAIPRPPILKKHKKSTLPEKPVGNFLRDGMAVPYLNLFEGITRRSGKLLPITRIIIGPHPDKHRRQIAVKKLLSQNHITAEVSISEIPYIG